jgi:hypothetical protein
VYQYLVADRVESEVYVEERVVGLHCGSQQKASEVADVVELESR